MSGYSSACAATPDARVRGITYAGSLASGGGYLPTTARRDGAGNRIPIADPESAAQLDALERNAPAFGFRYIADADLEQGIVHVVGNPNPVVVHGVQHLFYPTVQLPEWPDADRRSHFVFITADLEEQFISGILNEFLWSNR